MNNIRPNSKQRKQTPKYTEPTEWFELHGYSTYVLELSKLFGVSYHTVFARLRAGWPIEAALVAGTSDGWNVKIVHYLQNDPTTLETVKAKLETYFNPAPKEQPKKVVRNRGTRND